MTVFTVLKIAKLIAIGIYPVVEFGLGKTKAGSAIGVAFQVLSSILKAIKKLDIPLTGGKK